jgi:hypothetical protein
MTEAFIYDHVRSPRGRGKTGGSLNPITPMNLATQVLSALREVALPPSESRVRTSHVSPISTPTMPRAYPASKSTGFALPAWRPSIPRLRKSWQASRM